MTTRAVTVPECSATATSDADLARAIAAIPGDAWVYSADELVGNTWCCDLVAGHRQDHVVHVQTVEFASNDPDEYWMQWTNGGKAQLVKKPVCEAAFNPHTHDETYCLLPEEHEGPHTDGGQHWV